MKTSLLLSVFVVVCGMAGCASKDGFIDRQQFNCEPGQIVSILAGLDDPVGTRMEGVVDDQHTLTVLVGNNSQEDMVVTTIRAEQIADQTDAYRFSNGYRAVNETIPEGKEAEFRIPMTGRSIQPEFGDPRGANRPVSLAVTVALANGDQYRCRYEIQVR